MILLKIEGNKAFFARKSSEYKPINEIKKEDIYHLLEYIYKNSDFEFDKSDDSGDKQILSPADKIIYDRLYKKFNEVIAKKETTIAQVDSEFKEAYEKYIPKDTSDLSS